mmetsp:Transcript_20037/g.34443  ORF Transcript_20037/g.34443 Transcript_20037/m.34443 type:complete len:95 (-) Transcript_20037:13-297(-)
MRHGRLHGHHQFLTLKAPLQRPLLHPSSPRSSTAATPGATNWNNTGRQRCQSPKSTTCPTAATAVGVLLPTARRVRSHSGVHKPPPHHRSGNTS